MGLFFRFLLGASLLTACRAANPISTISKVAVNARLFDDFEAVPVNAIDGKNLW